MSLGHQRIKWRKNIAENFNRLSRVHERYRQTTDGRTTTYSKIRKKPQWEILLFWARVGKSQSRKSQWSLVSLGGGFAFSWVFTVKFSLFTSFMHSTKYYNASVNWTLIN